MAKLRTMTEPELIQVAKDAFHLLEGQIHTWNEGRMTVSAHALLALRDSVRGPGDKGEKDSYPLRRLVEIRAEEALRKAEKKSRKR